MSFSATRLTCFALISAIESDLRTEIEEQLGSMSEVDLFTPDIMEKVHRRRAKEYGNQPARSVASLIPFLDFADSYEILLRHKQRIPSETYETLRRTSGMLEKATEIRNRVAHSRPMEIDDVPVILDLAKALSRASGFSWRSLRATLQRLEEHPSYVLGLTIKLPMDPDEGPQHNLPVPDFDETGFFGRRKELQRIKKAIKGAYPVVSILGDGGIGKTSIALKAAYELLDDPTQPFEALVWVTAKATALTTNEIERITGAIEDSLGLFARAADELGAVNPQENPVEEVLTYLEHFKILLILDNLETVLDQRLRDFLLNLPFGSKVIITSRIGLGIENPVNLGPLSDDESVRLIRALAGTRNVTSLVRLPIERMQTLASAMRGHPAYIKWFVAGVQAGKRPEEMLSNNALLLDFCMSNVYDYISEDAQSVLRSMQVLPGARNQAELAFLNEFSANAIQNTLLQLITTNFVQMQNSESSQYFESTYQLSDFGKQYLDKRHPVDAGQRRRLVARNRRLNELGADLRVANSTTPYDPETVDIRGTGDFNVARLLRDALRDASSGHNDRALASCREAQILAPGYYEAWRVEAYIQTARADTNSALTAYERAHELAPESPTLNYFYGCFMLDDGGNPTAGLELLQRAARTEDPHPSVIANIAWAHLLLQNYEDSLSSAAHALSLRPNYRQVGEFSISVGLRSCVYGTRREIAEWRPAEAVELIEAAVGLVESTSLELLDGEPADRIIQIVDIARDLRESVDENFMLHKLDEFSSRLRERLRQLNVELLDRELGRIKNLVLDKFYGFVSRKRKTYFFHINDMINEDEWDYLAEDVMVAFFPDDFEAKGPRARHLRWLN